MPPVTYVLYTRIKSIFRCTRLDPKRFTGHGAFGDTAFGWGRENGENIIIDEYKSIFFHVRDGKSVTSNLYYPRCERIISYQFYARWEFFIYTGVIFQKNSTYKMCSFHDEQWKWNWIFFFKFSEHHEPLCCCSEKFENILWCSTLL